MTKKYKRNISWNPDVDPETEDRLAYLALNGQERWDYMMTLILATYPKKVVTYDKR
ncbi:hypothetical protein [Tunicatimonas pelagia]|uniref:hypothetical protein n=1 Tax=Tunicatimonas pelagia TaxID=931531 RepID=UPI002666F5B6|nr:hypothetical protein [Tunicatimonas pelagia]WKN41119.1 hypothetical protein P0M28_18970 [Tunicatimonas pelagia]